MSVERDEARRPLSASSNTALNTAVGALGLLIAVGGWLVKDRAVETGALAVVTVLLIALSLRMLIVSKSVTRLRRARPEDMAHAEYFSVVHRELESQLTQHLHELADGYLRFAASEIPGAYFLLYRSLMDAEVHPKRVLATDLTGNPAILMKRHDYLAANRRLIEAHGAINRIFICRLEDLSNKSFAKDFLALIKRHRAIGVTCGLAIRERLRPHEAVDFIIFGKGAVIVEEEQADNAYSTGRSTVYFKRIEAWERTFDDLWDDNETHAATYVLKQYEELASETLLADKWSKGSVRRQINAVFED